MNTDAGMSARPWLFMSSPIHCLDFVGEPRLFSEGASTVLRGNRGGTYMTDFIILPGIGGSDERHWQTRWERANPRMRRFSPQSWDRPDLEDWMAALDAAVAEAAAPPVLVAHSLACLLVAHWQGGARHPIQGAFLVAVPDPGSAGFPALARGFVDA